MRINGALFKENQVKDKNRRTFAWNCYRSIVKNDADELENFPFSAITLCHPFRITEIRNQ